VEAKRIRGGNGFRNGCFMKINESARGGRGFYRDEFHARISASSESGKKAATENIGISLKRCQPVKNTRFQSFTEDYTDRLCRTKASRDSLLSLSRRVRSSSSIKHGNQTGKHWCACNVAKRTNGRSAGTSNGALLGAFIRLADHEEALRSCIARTVNIPPLDRAHERKRRRKTGETSVRR